MPELPDITVYVEALARRIVGEPLTSVTIRSPFLLRSVDPPLQSVIGRRVVAVQRLGKRIAIALEEDLFIVLHLMIAGRLRWLSARAKLPRIALASFVFPNGTLVLTEAGTKRRAALHIARGASALDRFNRGGLEVLHATVDEFAGRLTSENHTLKRALTDPRFFSGIGNAYSDEILHRARLSPLKTTRRLDSEDVRRLFTATREVLQQWIERLRADAGDSFPEKVTAFRDGMAVHGRYGQPCPVCGTAVQRIRYAENETNYCPRCQTEGRLLADRAMSRLLREDWPKRIEELEGP